VSFISSQPLQDVTLAVVQELKPYVTVVPSHFDQVTSGTRYQIRLVISISDGTPPGEMDGAIQLKSTPIPFKVFAVPLTISLVVSAPTPTSIPSEVALPSLDRIVTSTTANPTFAANEIDVSVRPGTPDSVVEALALA